jgi:hypothetical protein
MGIQQIPDQIKKAPTQGLRAVFSGIGRILMSADRPQASRAETTARTERYRPAHRRSRSAAPAETRWRSLDQTNNVRLLSPEELGDHLDDEAGAEPDAELVGETGAQHDQEQGAGLPLPGYDSLSIASIRARLRGLDAAQLRTMIAYESKNAERAEVLGMFERRIDKLETGR